MSKVGTRTSHQVFSDENTNLHSLHAAGVHATSAAAQNAAVAAMNMNKMRKVTSTSGLLNGAAQPNRNVLGDISNRHREQTNVFASEKDLLKKPLAMQQPTHTRFEAPVPIASAAAVAPIMTARHVEQQQQQQPISIKPTDSMDISASPAHAHAVVYDSMEDDNLSTHYQASVAAPTQPSATSVMDTIDRDDAQLCSEYIGDIMEYLKKIETRYAPSSTYMSLQVDINARMREILIDWIVEVHLKFKLGMETLYLTVNIIDRFLEKRAVSRNKLQLVGCTAMLIAAKYEEIYAPEVMDFVSISDRAYTKEQILQMEGIMLNTLRFNLTVPSCYRFSQRYTRLAGGTVAGDDTLTQLTNYIMELTLQNYSFLNYKPSVIACGSLLLAMTSLQQGWTATLVHATGYEVNDLVQCVQELCSMLHTPNPKYRAVRKKYSVRKYGEVASKIDIPTHL